VEMLEVGLVQHLMQVLLQVLEGVKGHSVDLGSTPDGVCVLSALGLGDCQLSRE
jgi:hypothetical protein